MAPVRRAVIDVGTNSVKLLVADVTGQSVSPVFETSEQTRLGHGFFVHRVLQASAIDRTARSVARFAEAARQRGAVALRIVATAAAREAPNQAELRQAIEGASGLPLEIISGEQEADWVYAGVCSDPALAGKLLLILDIGGGSTEFILGEGPNQLFRRSFSLGTVRLTESIHVSDPPAGSELQACRDQLARFLSEQVTPTLAAALPADWQNRVQFASTGGTASILASIELRLEGFDRARIEAVCLSRHDVWGHVERLWRLPLAERRKLPGLPPERADVILAGAVILAMVMEQLQLASLMVSTRGLRFAALLDH